MKSKTEIIQAMKTTVEPGWANCLAWILDGTGWRDADKLLPLIGNPVLAWDDESGEYLIARYYHNQGEPPQWVVCDKDRRTNITKWTNLE